MDDYIIIENTSKLSYIKDNLERIIVLDFNKYWNNIEKSYKNNQDIENQFNLDIVRCHFFINECPINNTQMIKEYLYRNFNKTLVNEIMMISTQVLMGTPYEIISNSIHKYNWYLSELSLTEKNIDKQMCIYLTVNDFEIKIIGKKKLRIFTLDDFCVDKNLFFVDILIEIDLLNKNELLVKVEMK